MKINFKKPISTYPPIYKRIKDVEIGEIFTIGGALYIRIDPSYIHKEDENEIVILHLGLNCLFKEDPNKQVTIMNAEITVK